MPSIYIVDDAQNWRTSVVDAILDTTDFSEGDVQTFASVNDVLIHMGIDIHSPLTNQRPSRHIPDAIITDNDTGAGHSGMDLLRLLAGTGIARVMLSGSGSESRVKAAGGQAAEFLDKLDFDYQPLAEALNRSMQAVEAEKLSQDTSRAAHITPEGFTK